MWVGGSLERWDKKDGEASVWWASRGGWWEGQLREKDGRWQ